MITKAICVGTLWLHLSFYVRNAKVIQTFFTHSLEASWENGRTIVRPDVALTEWNMKQETSPSFSQLVMDSYREFRKPAVYLLVASALIGRYCKIPLAIEGSLLAMGVILLQLLFEIHQEMDRQRTFTRFPEFHSAAVHFSDVVRDCSKSNTTLTIRWLGLTMEYGAPYIDNLLRRLKESGDLKSLKLEIVMLDPKWSGMVHINRTWPDKASTGLSTLEDVYRRYCIDSNTANVSLRLFKYEHMPNWHGFMINDRHLYLSVCGWMDGMLLGGENEYELVEGRVSRTDIAKIQLFLGWFKYCQKTQILGS